MIISSMEAEREAVLHTARQMCAAARTAPKACGVDHISTCIAAGDDLEKLAAEMERLVPEIGFDFPARDAANVRASHAVVLIGTVYQPRGLADGCAYCNFQNCAECGKGNGVCVYDPMDLGIALGSAVALAADFRVDNRVMYSIGKAALSLGYMGADVRLAMGIPLAAAGKSPFYDRSGL